jgi:hypothetical protein
MGLELSKKNTNHIAIHVTQFIYEVFEKGWQLSLTYTITAACPNK